MGMSEDGSQSWSGRAHALGGMARDMLSADGVDATLAEACRRAVDLIDGCQAAGVSLVRRGELVETPAATSHMVYAIHGLQQELREGPCWDAEWIETTVRIDDLSAETRWPRFAARAVGSGVRSMLCFQLFTHRDTLGALNLFSNLPHAFNEDAVEVGDVFAAHVAIALAGAQAQTNLGYAVRSRQLIGEAVGILAKENEISTIAAFASLRSTSQQRNLKLRELAARLVAGHNQDSAGPGPTGDGPPSA